MRKGSAIIIFAGTVLIYAASVLSSGASGEMSYDEDALYKARHRMVQHQLRARGIRDPEVLRVMMEVPRHRFVPEYLAAKAYEDMPLPIGYGQTTTQPYIVAYMADLLQLSPSDRVLEIGTGCGYQTAILAEMAKEVYTVEIRQPLADAAGLRLKEMGYDNIEIKLGDGHEGWAEKAPFDAIIVTAAPEHIPVELVDQLKKGGRMVVPVGSYFQELYLVRRTDTGYSKQALLPVRFVPMVRPDNVTE